MTDYTPEALEALSKKAPQGEWRTRRLDQSTQILAKIYVGETPDYNGDAANFVVALVNAYRTGQLIHAVPSGDEVEAVARKLAPFMEGGREYDQMPATRRELKIWSRNGMALINDATQDDAQEAATAAITALDAVRKARENGDG